jgi:hypothetical protein
VDSDFARGRSTIYFDTENHGYTIVEG